MAWLVLIFHPAEGRKPRQPQSGSLHAKTVYSLTHYCTVPANSRLSYSTIRDRREKNVINTTTNAANTVPMSQR